MCVWGGGGGGGGLHSGKCRGRNPTGPGPVQKVKRPADTEAGTDTGMHRQTVQSLTLTVAILWKTGTHGDH